MELKVIQNELTVCKISEVSDVNFKDEFCFLSKTDQELSLVCSIECVPEKTLEREDHWRAFRIEGILDFSLIGILSKITTILAEERIGVFAISTYNTDYILTKSENFEKALLVLSERGYKIVEN